MKISRRTFIKLSGATVAGAAVGGLGFNLSPVEVYAQNLRIKGAKETSTVCCYCSVGCGIIVHTDAKGKVINTEGDPEHPINQGALCAKGASLYQLAVNDNRLKKVRYRAPYRNRWEEVPWDWALNKIAANVKKSRDAGFMEKNAQGQTVNRTNGIASVGSAAIDNEECWLYQKFLRALGIVYLEHQARI
ncbi:MAG: formate dehydrogenase [Deltaproteobacteria bacterium RBG_13_43_22]|nr:MAG: formate dehydrogenase [Deltaproteobacteria bacterium RBG_13_43_22]